MSGARYLGLTFVAILVICLSSGANGQEIRPLRGIMPNADLLSGSIDHIDLISGKVNLNIPLGSLPAGPGGSGYDLTLKYDSRLYSTSMSIFTIGLPNGQTVDVGGFVLNNGSSIVDGTGGWTYSLGSFYVRVEVKPNIDVNLVMNNPNMHCNGEDARHVKLILVLSDLSEHTLHLKGYETFTGSSGFVYVGDGYNGIYPDGHADACSQSFGWPAQVPLPLTYYTDDGTYLRVVSDTNGMTLYYPDGRRAVKKADGGRESYDANDNKVEIINACADPECDMPYTVIRDAALREIRIDRNITDAPSWTGYWRRDAVTMPGPNGPMTSYIDWEMKSIGGYYNPIGSQVEDYQLSIPFGFVMPSIRYIQLPIGNPEPIPLGSAPPAERRHEFYEFGYSDMEDLGYGELDSIRFPTGAEYRYRYSLEGTGTSSNPGDPMAIAQANQIYRKTITDNTANPVTLEWNFQYGGPGTVITNPDGGISTHHFTYAGRTPVLQRIEGPNGSGRRLEWELNVPYGLRNPYGSAAAKNPYIRKEVVTSGNVNGEKAKNAVIEYAYDKNGNVRLKKEYEWVDYPNETGGALLRQTEYNYYAAASDASVVSNDAYAYSYGLVYRRLNAVRRRTIKDGGNNPVAASEYVYDDAFSRGNVITERRWNNQLSTSLPGLGQLSGNCLAN